MHIDAMGQFIYLIFYLRLFYFSDLISRLKEGFVLHERISAIINIGELIIKVLMINHVLACGWHFLGDVESKNTSEGWILRYELKNSTVYSRYINSYYYTFNIMSTVGSQIYPETDSEKLFNVLMTIMTSLIFGYTITTIGNIIESL